MWKLAKEENPEINSFCIALEYTNAALSNLVSNHHIPVATDIISFVLTKGYSFIIMKTSVPQLLLNPKRTFLKEYQ